MRSLVILRSMPIADMLTMPKPTTPLTRLITAAMLAAPSLAARLAVVRAQIGTPHVYVIACPDCDIGQQFIAGFLGPRVSSALCGPALLSMPLHRFEALIPETDRAGVMAPFAGAGDADVRIALAVNDSSLTLRVIAASVWEQRGAQAVVACVEWPAEYVAAHEHSSGSPCREERLRWPKAYEPGKVTLDGAERPRQPGEPEPAEGDRAL